MSVSLREQILKTIEDWDSADSCEESYQELTDQILSLFPPQLTEEQIKKIIVDITNKWTNSIGNPFDLEGEQAKAIAKALATPTFSGEKKPPYCSHFNQDGCTQNCFECDYSTEQKEYCKCKKPWRGVVYEGKCMECGKPILAEKKEGTGMKITGRFWSWIEVREDHHDLAEIEISCEDLAKQLSNTDVQDLVEFTIRQRGYQSQEYASEPKPKDRIEPIPEFDNPGCCSSESIRTRRKLNELIRHINKES